MKKLISLVMLMMMVSGSVFAMSFKPRCITNAEAVCYYKKIIAGNEAFQARMLALGNPRDEYTDLGTDQAKAKVIYYSSLPANDITNPCIVNNEGKGNAKITC